VLCCQIYALLGKPGAEERAWLRRLPDFGVVRFCATRPSALHGALSAAAPRRLAQVAVALLRYVPTSRDCAETSLQRLLLVDRTVL